MNTDSRLKPAYDLIDSGKIAVLSLDIFDTLFWRKVPSPSDLFIMIGEHLKSTGWLIDQVTPISFAELRIKAERMARQKKAKQLQTHTAEITLKEIYWGLHAIFNKITLQDYLKGKKGLYSEADVDDLLNIELAFEKRTLHFDENILFLIQHALKKQVAVILVSDTYFEKDQLEFLLRRDLPSPGAGLLNAISYIFPSCEYGRGKCFGLLEGIVKASNADPQSILHIGDNKYGDFLAAQKAGMQALLFPKYTNAFDEIVHREIFNEPIFLKDDANIDQLTQHRLQKVSPLLDPEEGDFGFTAIRSKMLFSNCEENQGRDAFFWKYGASVLGPVITGFTHWIYQRCREMNISTAFCLMREGRLYAKMIKEYAPYFPEHKLEAKELWISRQYAIRACIRYATPKELNAVLNTNPVEPFTVGSYFSHLGLDVKKVKKFAKYENVKLYDESFGEEISEYLSKTDVLKETIIASSAAKRERFLKYLSSIVDLDKTKELMFVDVGWIGTSQSAIQVILQIAGYPIKVHGLYLGTSYKSQYGMLQGSIREGFLINGGYPTEASRVIQSGVHILEQTAIPNLGTLIDFDGQGSPVLGKTSISKVQLRQAETIQKGIFAFCHQFGQSIQKGLIKSNDNAKVILRSILMRANGFPTKEEARKFQSWQHDWMITQLYSHLTENSVLGENAFFQKFAGQMLPQMTIRDIYLIWPPGYAAKVDPYLTLSSELVRSKQIPLQCFMSVDSVPVKIYMDVGNGMPKKPSISIDVHSNANRSFFTFQGLSSIKHPIKAVKILVGTGEHAVKIQSLRLALDTYSNPKSQELVFFENTEENLHNNSPISFVHSFQNKDIYAMQIRLCFNIK